MRMAVCLSGQLRQWDLAVDNQKWFWETAEQSGVTEIDYFIHTCGKFQNQKKAILMMNQ